MFGGEAAPTSHENTPGVSSTQYLPSLASHPLDPESPDRTTVLSQYVSDNFLRSWKTEVEQLSCCHHQDQRKQHTSTIITSPTSPQTVLLWPPVSTTAPLSLHLHPHPCHDNFHYTDALVGRGIEQSVPTQATATASISSYTISPLYSAIPELRKINHR